jgi:hypothetical protein
VKSRSDEKKTGGRRKDMKTLAAFALAKVKGGTRLTFTQSGIPDDQVEPIKEGWKEHYWDKMKALLEAEA